MSSKVATMGFRHVTPASTDKSRTEASRGSYAPKLVRHHTIGPGGNIGDVLLRRPTSLPVTSTRVSTRTDKGRPRTTSDEVQVQESEGQNQRVPILGPTRQQTRLYLGNRRERHRYSTSYLISSHHIFITLLYLISSTTLTRYENATV